LRFGAKGIAGIAEMGGEASGSRAKARTTSYRQEGVEQIHKVTARGTNTKPSWEVCDPENPILDGRYLGMDNLCEVAAHGKHHQVTARFVCRRRDLDLAEIDCTVWIRTTTKKKLALAVVASELGKTLEELDEGMLTLCRSVLGPASRREGQDEER
jgi:hypothetical protein